MSFKTTKRVLSVLSKAARSEPVASEVVAPYFPSLAEFEQMDDDEIEAYAYRLVADHCSDLITLQRASGEILFASRNSQDRLGWHPAELLGKNLYELFHQGDIQQLAEQLEHESRTEVECRVLTSSGEWRWTRLQCRINPARDPASDRAATLALLTDIDELVKLAKSTENAKRALLDAERATAISHLAGAVGHEIGNPLMAAFGHLRLLQERLDELDPETRRAIGGLNRSVKRIRKITEELDLLASPFGGDSEEVDLANIVERVCALTAWIDGDIERRVISAPLTADRSKLYQLVYNLLVTHLQATPADQSQLIQLVCEPDDGMVKLEVSGTQLASNQTLRVDLLKVLRGEGVDFAVPLRLAEEIAEDLGAEWHAEVLDQRLLTRVILPRKPSEPPTLGPPLQ